uniref:H-2 class I histocompatibility antigen, Q9 alpha chain n=1 Tax=Maylandia zebra TaxID=106582 RepID=UPI000D3162FF|nr:H-2 class I histocompatibility antigen, Q9 alpha chain-like [Maylandia zebra]
MRTLVLLVLLEIHGAAAVTHSLQYFYTASTGIERFPRFVAVGVVDGEQIDYYDSVSEKNVLKQTWMEGVRDESRITDIRRGAQQSFQGNIGIAMERFNQTTGVHIFQWMYGCEVDDETKELNGYEQFGYDGEDFITLDTKSGSWAAPKQQAVITKHKWDSDTANTAYKLDYYTTICPDWLKKYLNYGKSSLMRTVLPSVSLLQKSSSLLVTCHATGFYPNKAELVWRKDGVEFHNGVHKGEILTNNDGTFQMSADLNISSVPAEDWRMYDCVFQLAGVNKDIVTKLDREVLKTNEGPSGFPVGAVVGVVVGAMVLLGVAALVYFKCFKKENDGFKPANSKYFIIYESFVLLQVFAFFYCNLIIFVCFI